MGQVHVLDNCVWAALHGPHSKYADKTDHACVYKPEYYRFAAVSEYTEKAYKELASIVNSGRTIAIAGTGQTVNYQEWTHIASPKVHLMILEEPIKPPDLPYEKLTPTDTKDTIALSKTSNHTEELNLHKYMIGDFYGIKNSGRIVSIAGERMQLDEYSEVSGVCTHPDYRRRGYGGGLTLHKCSMIHDRGKTPFLGVLDDNSNAVQLYKKLGFIIHTTVHLDMLQRTRAHVAPL